jgi:hypothetical protein
VAVLIDVDVASAPESRMPAVETFTGEYILFTE